VAGYASPPGGLTDLAQYILQSTRFPLVSDATQPDWTLATQWPVQSLDKTGTLDVTIVQPGVVSATPYWLRVAAVDNSGNRSAWSAASKISTVGDTAGPGQPTGIVTAAGMNVFSVRWDASNDEDYAYTEVQWRVSPSGNWSSVQVGGTMTVVVGLVNGTLYNVRVRSVDRSGNTLDADTLTYDVGDLANSEKGWVAGADVTPTALPGSALVWDAATIAQVFAGKINADWILAGSLVVGQGANTDADAIKVVDSKGNVVGRWTSVPTNIPGGEPGGGRIEMFDPPRAADGYTGQPNYKMTLDTRGLIIWDTTDKVNPIALATVGPLGIDAASITFGSARGGHNLIQNSSFELGAFAATLTTTSVWDVLADWNAAGSRQGADINITTGAGALTMAAV
jgi:chitodextrinase